ncbi:MAG: flagellar FliJ family protein [Phycisphaerales bacterium]|nr:MAG: flagellar FliJ family protein [Phycisphaerales bacterium]
MARFVFPLQPLLRARRRAEQARQRAVAEVERERLSLEDRLRRQQRQIAEGKRWLGDRLVGTLDVPVLRDQAGATMLFMRKAQRVALELAGVHRRLEAVRAELIEATKRRRAIELLRDRRFQQWKADLDKAETAALDELAVIAAARREPES